MPEALVAAVTVPQDTAAPWMGWLKVLRTTPVMVPASLSPHDVAGNSPATSVAMAAITSSRQNTLERMILPPFLFGQGMPLASPQPHGYIYSILMICVK
jgi:hypothetical protein